MFNGDLKFANSRYWPVLHEGRKERDGPFYVMGNNGKASEKANFFRRGEKCRGSSPSFEIGDCERI